MIEAVAPTPAAADTPAEAPHWRPTRCVICAEANEALVPMGGLNERKASIQWAPCEIMRVFHFSRYRLSQPELRPPERMIVP